MSELKVLVCRKTSDPDPRVAGAKRGYHCALCHTEVWLSPEGQRQLNAGGATILCNPCGLPLVKDSHEVRFNQPAREQLLKPLSAHAPRYACRICILTKGLKGSEVDKLLKTQEELIEHLRAEHGIVVEARKP